MRRTQESQQQSSMAIAVEETAWSKVVSMRCNQREDQRGACLQVDVVRTNVQRNTDDQPKIIDSNRLLLRTTCLQILWSPLKAVATSVPRRIVQDWRQSKS